MDDGAVASSLSCEMISCTPGNAIAMWTALADRYGRRLAASPAFTVVAATPAHQVRAIVREPPERPGPVAEDISAAVRDVDSPAPPLVEDPFGRLDLAGHGFDVKYRMPVMLRPAGPHPTTGHFPGEAAAGPGTEAGEVGAVGVGASGPGHGFGRGRRGGAGRVRGGGRRPGGRGGGGSGRGRVGRGRAGHRGGLSAAGQAAVEKLRTNPPQAFAGRRIQQVGKLDGSKVFLEKDGLVEISASVWCPGGLHRWLGARRVQEDFSGQAIY